MTRRIHEYPEPPRTTPIRHLLGLCLLLGCAIAFATQPLDLPRQPLASTAAPAADPSPEQVATLRQAEFTSWDAVAPPGDEALWRQVALPDRWSESRPGVTGLGWYRIRFGFVPDADEIHAVLLPRIAMNAAVYLNGRQLGSGGSMTEPVARNWNRPLYFLVPPRLLRSGENVLHVQLASVPYSQPSLYPVLIGEDRVLRARHERLLFQRITVNQAITAFIGSIGVLMLSMWVRRRKDTMYGYFGAAALVWACNAANLFVTHPPFANATWEILVNASFPAFVALLMVSLLRFMGTPKPRFERLLWPTVLLAVVSLALAPPEAFLVLTGVWHFVSLLVVVATVVWLAGHAWRRRDPGSMLLVAAILTGLLFGVHDWVVHSGLWWIVDPGATGASPLFLVQYASPLVFAVVGLMLSVRFASALNDYERLNTELEARVARKHEELETNFRQLERLSRERAALEERERIVADLHDGLGSQLVTTLRLVESNRLGGAGMAELLRDCLDDLRIVMQALAPGDQDLDALLGSLRHRLAPRLERAGIAIEWRLDGTLPDRLLSAHAALHVQRILQEAFANIVKHAGATRIEVTSGVLDGASARPGARFIRIADNGRGIRSAQRGRGIENMRNRARQLGATLEITSTEAGTVVTLLLDPANEGWRCGAEASG